MDDALNHEDGWSSKPWRIAAWSAGGALMLVPVLVQLITGDLDWTAGDFIFVAVILLTGCTLFDAAARRAPNFAYLAGIAAAMAAGFGLFMVNGAVGLVGNEDESANLLFGLVILVSIFGAIRARGRAEPLAKAMFAAATAQVAISTIVMAIVGLGAEAANPLAEIFGLSMFAALWSASGWLFRQSIR